MTTVSLTSFSPGGAGTIGAMTIALRSDLILPLPVRLHGIQLGRPADLLLDREELKVVGIDVHCGDEVNRFLPLPTAIVTAEEIAIRSPLVLFEEDELAFYQARTFGLTSLRGTSVEHAAHQVGSLEEIIFLPDGTLTELIVEKDGEERHVPFDGTAHVELGDRSAA